MDALQMASQMVQAFNQREIESALALFSDHAEVVNVSTGERFSGKEGIRRYMEGWIKAFPDAQITQPRFSGGGNLVVDEFIGKGTQKGPLVGPQGTLPATGRRLEMRFCEVWELKDGKFESGRLYYDAATMMGQLGISALPAAKAESKPAEIRPH